MKQLRRKANMLRVREHRCDDPGETLKLRDAREKLSRQIKDLRKQRRQGIVGNHAQTKGQAMDIFSDAQAKLTEAFMSVAKLADDAVAELHKEGEEEEDEKEDEE